MTNTQIMMYVDAVNRCTPDEGLGVKVAMSSPEGARLLYTTIAKPYPTVGDRYLLTLEVPS